VPAPALLTGPRLNEDVAAAARESLKVQVDAALQSLVSQLGLGKAVAPAPAPVPSAAPAPAPAPASSGPPPPAPAPVAKPSANAFPVAPTNVEGRGIPEPSGR
jgi:hypothetical protein